MLFCYTGEEDKGLTEKNKAFYDKAYIDLEDAETQLHLVWDRRVNKTLYTADLLDA